MTDKPFRSIDEQVRLLESRGVSVNLKTGLVLRQEGYYSVINGYKDLFIDRAATGKEHEDRFEEGTTFDEIYWLFKFDRQLRSIMLRYFTLAESKLRTACSYCFAEEYPDYPQRYLDYDVYRQDPKYKVRINLLIKDLKRIVEKNEETSQTFKRNYIAHYVDNHDGVPIWVLTNYLSLGQTFKFFEFQKESMRNKVAKYFSDLYRDTHVEDKRVSERMLRISYDHIKDFRNICAHDERLFCARVSPTKNVTFSNVLDDLRIVQTAAETMEMVHELLNLFSTLTVSGMTYAPKLLEMMGIIDLRYSFRL